MDILKLNNDKHPYSTSPAVSSKYIENMATFDSVDYHDVYDKAVFTKELNDDYDREFMFVDRNMVNF